ncbi:unnamed protein product, partial [Rotaria sp. Silwood2]
ENTRNLRKRNSPKGYFSHLHKGQSPNIFDNLTAAPSVQTTSTLPHLQNRLQQRLRRSLQAFIAKRLKPGRRRAKEHKHHMEVSLNEYNYLKSIGIRSQYTAQMSFFTNLKIIENLVYGTYKDKVCYVGDFECKVRKSNSIKYETENGDKFNVSGQYVLYMKILRAERSRLLN